jgi:hypothetical protein
MVTPLKPLPLLGTYVRKERLAALALVLAPAVAATLRRSASTSSTGGTHVATVVLLGTFVTSVIKHHREAKLLKASGAAPTFRQEAARNPKLRAVQRGLDAAYERTFTGLVKR